VDGKLTISPGTRVAVMGLGVSGRSAVRYALQQQAEIFVSDIRPQEKLIREESDILCSEKISWEAGGHTVDFLAQAEIVIISPGISIRTPLIGELRSRGIEIAGELAFASAQIEKPIVGITGTNGKTTVTTLVGEFLKEAGKKIFIGGNIGTSLFDYLSDPKEVDVLVIEVSSFQLETSGDFAPDVAILLNISPDHLDRHGTFNEYCRAKMNIFTCQKKGGMAIINGDDSNCCRMSDKILCDVVKFGMDKKFAAGISGNNIVLYLNGQTNCYALGSTQLKGQTGAYNSAAAILAAEFLGCSRVQIQSVLDTFSPLEHRMEFVEEVNGVTYYNDSKATNTGAVIGALLQIREKVVLIAGGRDKGDDYTVLKTAVAQKVKLLVLIGESSCLIREAVEGAVDIVEAVSMKDAVQKSAEIATAGDSVLLSPACSSFDMYTNYGHRGRVFKEEVRALRAEKQKEVR